MYIFWRKRTRERDKEIKGSQKAANKSTKENPLSALQNIKFHAFPTEDIPSKQLDATETPTAAAGKSATTPVTPVSTTGINLIDGKSTVGKSLQLDNIKFHAFPGQNEGDTSSHTFQPFHSTISPIGLSSPAEKPLRESNHISSPFGRLTTTTGGSPAAGPRRLPPMHPPTPTTAGRSETAAATTPTVDESNTGLRSNRPSRFTFRPPPEIKKPSIAEENVQNRDKQPSLPNAYARKGSIPFELSMKTPTTEINEPATPSRFSFRPPPEMKGPSLHVEVEGDQDRQKMPPLLSSFSKKGSTAFERTNSAAGPLVAQRSNVGFNKQISFAGIPDPADMLSKQNSAVGGLFSKQVSRLTNTSSIGEEHFILTEEEVNKMKVSELRRRLKDLGLSSLGRMDELKDRLIEIGLLAASPKKTMMKSGTSDAAIGTLSSQRSGLLGTLASQRSGISGLDSKGADSKSTPTKGGSKDGSGSPLKGGSGILVPSGPSGFFPLSTGRSSGIDSPKKESLAETRSFWNTGMNVLNNIDDFQEKLAMGMLPDALKGKEEIIEKYDKHGNVMQRDLFDYTGQRVFAPATDPQKRERFSMWHSGLGYTPACDDLSHIRGTGLLTMDPDCPALNGKSGPLQLIKPGRHYEAYVDSCNSDVSVHHYKNSVAEGAKPKTRYQRFKKRILYVYRSYFWSKHKRFIQAAKEGDMVSMDFLLGYMTEFGWHDEGDSNNATPLYWAAANGHVDCVKLLLASGADYNKADDNMRTPLYWAKTNKHKKVIEAIKERTKFVKNF